MSNSSSAGPHYHKSNPYERAYKMNSDLKQIIEAAQQGNETAFTELYEQTCDCAYYLADRFLSDQNNIKDVLQESYISVFRNIQSFDTNKDIMP